MRNFDCVIFDIDGTIVSTIQLIFDSMNHVSEKYLEKRFTNQELLDMFGPTEEYILKYLFKENFKEAEKDYFSFYAKNHPERVTVFTGIKEIIEELNIKKINLAIFTGKGKRSTEITLKLAGYSGSFPLIITGDDVKDHKPSGEGIIKILDHFKISKERTLMIGDSAHDVIAARSAGVKIASVLWDSFSQDEINKLKPDYIFGNVDSLKFFLQKNT